jgi:transposase
LRIVSTIALPDDPAALRAVALDMQAQIEAQASLLEQKTSLVAAQSDELKLLREYIRLLKHYRFGRSSEKSGELQGDLFNEAEHAVVDSEGDEEEVQVEAHGRKKRGRKPIPASLPREEVLHDLPEGEKHCPHDGAELERIGEEVCEQLEFVPARLRVLRHVRPKYACPRCRTGIHTPALPPQPIPKSLASPTLLAHVCVSKYADGLPLYRQEEMLRRIGIELPRATLAHWMVRVGELVQPVINLLWDRLLASDLLQCDETRYQVLKELGKRAQSQSYLWVAYAPEPGIVLYQYDPTRSAEVPKQMLAGFQGYLQTDGYEGYGAVAREPGITHVGCWAHARRKFDEALKGQRSSKKKTQDPRASKARAGLALIQKLYEIDRSVRGRPPDERHQTRQQKMKPLLERIRSWLDDALPRIPPQSLTGKALGYLNSQWSKLVRVLDDGRIPLDTNAVENAIRPFVVGRKAWLFADTVRGAEASANLYSLIETAKRHGLDPFGYLRVLFRDLPRATTVDEIEDLLPHAIDRGRIPDAGSFLDPK